MQVARQPLEWYRGGLCDEDFLRIAHASLVDWPLCLIERPLRLLGGSRCTDGAPGFGRNPEDQSFL
jgi:hypothetical protein